MGSLPEQSVVAERYHDISCGHRVVGHENKCALLHGHNYRITFTCRAHPLACALDGVGRVIDFSVIKSKLCMWLEDNWDHRFLAWTQDPALRVMADFFGLDPSVTARREVLQSIVWVPFNPTAENMALYLLNEVGPAVLPGGIDLLSVRVEETRKCSAEATLERRGMTT